MAGDADPDLNDLPDPGRRHGVDGVDGHGVDGLHDLHDLLLELVRSVELLHVVDSGATGQVSLSELFTLHELDISSGVTQQELAARLRLDKSTVSRLVAGLETRGMLARERDPGNRRLVRLTITAAGRRMHRDLADALHAHQRTLLADMAASERTALRTGLAALLRALHGAGPPRLGST